MPAAFVITTNFAPVLRTAAIAMPWTTPCGLIPPGSPASTACCNPRWEARLCATASARCSYCFVELPGQVPLHHAEASRHGDREDRDHHDDDLGGQALPLQPSDASLHRSLPSSRHHRRVFPKCNNGPAWH